MAKPKAITIRNIAQEAGVSISTVSNVLNGNIDEMSVETLVRVQHTIERLNYRPNQIARGLVTRRTATIGMILAEIETPLFLQALTSIERNARSAGYNLLFAHARNLDEERQALDLLLEKQVEGLILLSTSELKEDADLEDLRTTQTPAVIVNRSTRHPEFDQVNWDNAAGIYDAVHYLVDLGHRRIAHLLGPRTRAGTQERLEGFLLGLKRHGIERRDDYLPDGDYTASPQLWIESTRKLIDLPEPPTAIIASDDTVAGVVIATLREAGLDVPGDVSVVGIDDQPFLSFLALTTIRLPVLEAGRQAIEMLIQRIANPERSVEHVILSCPLIKRKTAGPVSQSINSVSGAKTPL
jgi:LacI family transcriptional regulator